MLHASSFSSEHAIVLQGWSASVFFCLRHVRSNTPVTNTSAVAVDEEIGWKKGSVDQFRSNKILNQTSAINWFSFAKDLRKTCTKTFLDHLYLPTEVSNSRARFHTFLKHFSCPTQWTVFLSERLCSGATVEGRMLQANTWGKDEHRRVQKETVETTFCPPVTPEKQRHWWNLHSNQRQNRPGRVQTNSFPKYVTQWFLSPNWSPLRRNDRHVESVFLKDDLMSQPSTKRTIIQIYASFHICIQIKTASSVQRIRHVLVAPCEIQSLKEFMKIVKRLTREE